MTSYLGPVGGLVAIDCPSSLVSTSTRAMVERVTTAGVVNVQVSPRARREWRVDWGVATPAEVAGLGALVAGEHGFGPWWFVDPWAQVTNLLDPRSSVLDFALVPDTSLGGPVELEDGSRAGRSIVVANPAAIVAAHRLGTDVHRVPVIPGLPVTGSVYATGAGAVDVRLTWWDSANVVLSSTSYATFTPGSTMRRLHRTATPPAGAASVTVGVRGASRYARPAVTWTADLMDWHVGQGAPAVAIPADLSQSIILATSDSRGHGQLAAVSSTIREIG